MLRPGRLVAFIVALCLPLCPAMGQEYLQAAPSRSLGPPTTDTTGYSSNACLSPADGRRIIQSSGAVSLATAAKVARDSSPGEIVDYKICRGSDGYSYVLTILAGNGKIARAWIDASSGKLISVR